MLRVNWILAIPLEARFAVLFLVGAALGAVVNWAIYSLAWSPRPISPWSKPPQALPRRNWLDCIPIVGWLLLRREAKTQGAGFWLRPLLIELSMGLGITGLYWWEIVNRGLSLPPDGPVGDFGLADWNAIAHVQFASHVLLLVFMTVATFIDLDEMLIPDTVTIPGTLLGLTIAFVCPWSLLPGLCWLPLGAAISQREFLHLNTLNHWPAMLSNGAGSTALWIALACWWGWCFAVMPRRWLTRRGLTTAIRIFLRRLYREPFTWFVAGLGVLGSLAIGMAWKLSNDAHWAGLLTALVGVVVAGGWTWLVRIVCSHAVGREAMGFGDVTLMAMIGAFLGWQASIITFFIAPLTGALMGVAMWLVHRSRVLPFGPYLCLGAVVVVFFWDDIWTASSFYFSLQWLVPSVLAIGIVLMALMLGGWRAILMMFEPVADDPGNPGQQGR